MDRVNNKRGYTSKNVVSCCLICQVSKNDMDYDEWVDWLTRLRANVQRLEAFARKQNQG
jgi:hypothetical protein